MSASKKTSSKPSKSPARAPKSSAPKPAASKKTAAPRRRPAAKPAAAAATVKPVASKRVQTTIIARVDVGFGNALFVRGEGAGLSWENGMAMDCVEGDLWRIVLPEAARGHVFKFLVNDLTWSVGPDFTAASGSSLTLTPEF